MKKLLSILLCACFTLSNAQSVTRLLAVSPFNNNMITFDTATYATINTKVLTFSGGSFQGLNGLARKPNTGVFYGVVNDGAGTRYLTTLNPITGALTSIGSLGDNFSQITFNGNNTLLGVTGSGASNPCKVYRINVANAAKSLINGVTTSYGQVICYNPVDNKVYHWASYQPNFNSYDTSFTTATTLTITSGNETLGAVYKTGGIFVSHDFNGNILKTRSTGSSTTSVNYTSNYLKGLAYITCSRSITPSFPVICSNSTVTAITLTMSGVVGATYQWYKNNVAVSGATLATLARTSADFGYYKCRINDGCGQDSLAPGVTFTTAPPPIVSITGNTFVCAPATVQLVGSSGGSSQWFRNGVSIPGANTNSYVPSTTGIYNMIKTNLNGCQDSSSLGKYVLVGSSPTITATASTNTICSNQTTVTLSSSGANTYTWSNNVTAITTTVSPLTTTIYSVSATGTTACLGTATVMITVNTTPTISVNSATVCSGYLFTIIPSGASTYTYSNGSSTISAITSTNINVSGTSSAGCVAQSSATSTLTVIPSPTISSTSGSVCLGLTYSTLPTGANTYSINGLSTTSVGGVTPAANALYSISGTGTNGCVSFNPLVVSVTVVPNPTVTAVTSASYICVGQASANLTGSGASTYTWNTSATGSNISVSPTIASIYTVTGTSTLLCKSSATVAINVLPLPQVGAQASQNFVCAGGSSTLTSIYSGQTYSWSNGSTLFTTVVNPTISSIYTLTGTDLFGCKNTGIVSVNVNTLNINVTPNSATVCLGNPITYSASGGLTALSYTWNGNSNFGTYQVIPTGNAVYTVNAIDANSCPQTKTVSASVYQLPVVSIAITRTLICLKESSTLTVNGASSYLWNNGLTTNVIVVTPTANVVYNYSVVGTDANNCVASASQSLTVSACTGINSIDNQSSIFNVYPNPSNGDFTIVSNSDLDLLLINQLGQTIQKIILNKNNNHQVSLNEIAKGIYFIVGTSNNQNIQQKIIVNK